MSIHRVLKQSLCALSLLCAATAHGVTVPTFDTLDPENLFTMMQGWAVGGGPTPEFNYAPVMKFTAGAAGELVSADLVLQMGCCAGASPQVSLRLLADNNGVPGQVLATAGASVSSSAQLVSGAFPGGVQIAGGSTYWFGVSTADSNAGHTWAQNVLGVNGTMAFTGAAWQQPGEWFFNEGFALGAFRVNVASPVDEPAVTLLLIVGGLPLALRLRKRL
jgi:hypothetical protein